MRAAGAGTAFRARFVEGPILRHVVVMAATGSVGLMAIFVVDLANLFYISRLGEQELAAAIGFASALLFFTTSVALGIAIAATALVSRALGAGRRDDARRMASASLVYMGLAGALLGFGGLPFLDPLLRLVGAGGRTHELAWGYLAILLPSTPILGLGMCLSGLLRSVGDARRSMYVTLAGAVATALLDPIFIFGLHLGVQGAAIVGCISRLVLLAVGLHGAHVVHRLLGRLDLPRFGPDARTISGIALPAILTNVATPIASAYVTAQMARFGDAAVAGQAIVDRIVPVAFGAVFALSGSVAPIVGQNFGARRFDRVWWTIAESLRVVTVYVLLMWGVLFLLQDALVRLFAAQGLAADLVRLFCTWLGVGFLFTGALFVANAAFNNLGFPLLSTLFNWGRATLGTIPFATAGAALAGAQGVAVGYALGSVVFGVVGVAAAFWVTARLDRVAGEPPPPLWRFTPPSADNLGESAAASFATDAPAGPEPAASTDE